MEYLIPAVLVVLLVGGFVTFLVLNATRKSGPAATGDEGAPGIGRDRTPLGDTSEHAEPEHGGAARPVDPGRRPESGEDADRLRREHARPASEELADRDV